MLFKDGIFLVVLRPPHEYRYHFKNKKNFVWVFTSYLGKPSTKKFFSFQSSIKGLFVGFKAKKIFLIN